MRRWIIWTLGGMAAWALPYFLFSAIAEARGGLGIGVYGPSIILAVGLVGAVFIGERVYRPNRSRLGARWVLGLGTVFACLWAVLVLAPVFPAWMRRGFDPNLLGRQEVIDSLISAFRPLGIAITAWLIYMIVSWKRGHP